MNTPKIPETMVAVVLTGHGGYDKLDYRTDMPTPRPSAGQVLIKVAGAGVNNTDINTRVAWYSKSVTDATNVGGDDGFGTDADGDGSWTGEPLEFPRIQGADCCGYVVAVGNGVPSERIGDRVLVRTMVANRNGPPMTCTTTGSENDGSFAQYMVADSIDALAIDSDWTDVELASLPCAYSTAEGMLHRGSVTAERVLITGASGGVGSAAVQLAKRRGAEVIAIAGQAKSASIRDLGADLVVDRDADLVAELGSSSVDVVIDVVAGPMFTQLLELLRPGGRYITAGAIAGPVVDLDVRTLYLKDLSFFGTTYQPDEILENLVSYVEANEVRPIVAKSFPLSEIVAAQQEFVAKKHVGKLVLIPPE